MPKLPRVQLIPFGSTGPTDDFEQFGSTAQGSTDYTKDIAVIQSAAAWLTGWRAAVIAGKAPVLQDMNGYMLVTSYMQAYMFQEGIPEWETGTTYFIGSIVKRPSTFELYGSLVNTNAGNALPSQVSDANWQYLGTLSGLIQAPYAMSNVEVNGGREIWQRGTSFSPITNGAYSADRCKMFFDSSPVVNVTREATTVKSGTYSSKIAVTNVSSASKIYEHQPIPNFVDYRGVWISRSVWVNTTLPNIKIAINDGVSSIAKSAAHPGDGAWHQLTVSLLVSASASQLDLQVGQLDGSIATGVWYVDSCMTTQGPVPNQFNPEDPAEALQRCQYFYEIGSLETSACILRRTTTPTTRAQNSLAFNTPKRIQATMTYNLISLSMWVLGNVGTASDPVSDTSNWAPADSGSATTQGNSYILVRNSDQGTYGGVTYQLSWTASADN